MPLVSYAQNFEDVLLHRVFGEQETGFYVDIGACHPTVGSVTKLFYDRGWSGINVEPGSVFSELAAARPRDVNLQIAVLDRSGEVAFIEDDSDRGMSCIAADDSIASSTRTVPCDTLEAIIDSHARNRPIDFIKVDAEGTESAIVHSTDWRRLRPRVLLLEATLPWSNVLNNQDWEPVLLEQGYVRVFFDGINCFYVAEENARSLQRHFEIPVNALDGAIRYEEDRLRMAVNERMQEAERLAGEVATQSTVLDERAAEIAHLKADRDALRAERDECLKQIPRLAAHHDALRAELDERLEEIPRLAADRDALRAELGECLKEIPRLAADHDALRAELDKRLEEIPRLAADRDTLRAELDECLEKLSRPAADQQAPAQASTTVPAVASARRQALRRVAKSAYMLVRPVVRPILWRLRGFMTASLFEEMRQLSEEMRQLQDRIETLAAHQQRPLPDLAPTVTTGSDQAIAEMRHLAVQMERTLLTIVVEQEKCRQDRKRRI